MQTISRSGRKRSRPNALSSRAHYWLMEAIARGYTTKSVASGFAIIALTREGYRDNDAMSAVARAWHDLTPTQAN